MAQTERGAQAMKLEVEGGRASGGALGCFSSDKHPGGERPLLLPAKKTKGKGEKEMNTQFFKDLALPFYGYNQPGT